jgi:RNA polymerase sigma-70 factor (ECF subfamily)
MNEDPDIAEGHALSAGQMPLAERTFANRALADRASADRASADRASAQSELDGDAESSLWDDEQLIQGLLLGDPDAVAALVRQYADDVYRFVYNQVGGSAQDAEDVVQETFVAALKAIHRFKGNSKLRTWLFSIASHKAIDHRRRMSRQVQVSTHEMVVPLPAEQVLPEQAVERFEVRQAVRQALLQLPPHYRTALILKYVEEMPVREMAVVMKRSIKSVESVLVRARRLLAQIFEGKRGGFTSGGGFTSDDE